MYIKDHWLVLKELIKLINYMFAVTSHQGGQSQLIICPKFWVHIKFPDHTRKAIVSLLRVSIAFLSSLIF